MLKSKWSRRVVNKIFSLEIKLATYLWNIYLKKNKKKDPLRSVPKKKKVKILTCRGEIWKIRMHSKPVRLTLGNIFLVFCLKCI